ncbi:micrococcal nuclease [Desulforamulus putei DSM 12395]|uniref:Micrococcal nuclease n=1 Tax=Desulforamulus putei DSM 12395 TaxID=1121429 RepID=A0A1M4ZA58_9FIRM|nr:thermonuclease family protein [Desulforamulus putei]SHF14894.1 micrococcal nuclease [Desulforamulus putei DSM 12395]
MELRRFNFIYNKVKGTWCISLTFIVLMLFTVVFSGCGSTSTSEVKQMSLAAGAQQVSLAAQTQTKTTTTVQGENKTLPLLKATVTRVIDGDTVHVSINGRDETVRMIGVNTPETHHPSKPVEYYGPEAEKFTRSQLDGKQIWLQKDVQERDKYGRLLAYIWLEQPASDSESEVRAKMYNAKLLLDGYAQVMTIPPNVKYADLFVKLQREAREGGRGLWSSGGQYSQGQGQTAQSAPMSLSKGPGPNGETIKGNINSKGEKIYHVPGGRYYDKTIPEAWFFTEEEAQAAGYRRSKV